MGDTTCKQAHTEGTQRWHPPVQGDAFLQFSLQLGMLYCSTVRELSAANQQNTRDADTAAAELSSSLSGAPLLKGSGGGGFDVVEGAGLASLGGAPAANRCLSDLADLISTHSGGMSTASTPESLLSGAAAPLEASGQNEFAMGQPPRADSCPCMCILSNAGMQATVQML